MMFEKIAVFLAGTVVGSFLNVCILRLPKQESIVTPRSCCPHCKSLIRWFDNIPLVSYVILRGRCRSCQKPIALRYCIVECLTGCIFLLLYNTYGWSWGFGKFLFFFCLLVVVSFIDIDYHAIPAYLCVLGVIVGVSYSIIPTFAMLAKPAALTFGALPIIAVFKGLIFGFGFTYLFKFFGDTFIELYLALRKQDSIEGERESLGLGDVDFMGVVGVFLGAKCVMLTFFIAPFIAIVYSIFALITKRSHLIPYLPYLSLATLVSFMWGDALLRLLFFH